MPIHDWIYSVYPPDAQINGRWGAVHIGVLCLCIAITVIIALFRGRSAATRKRILLVLASAIAVLELARRGINLSRGGPYDLDSLLYTLLPRPWCAISCWLTMAAVFTGKKALYNFSAMCSLLCSLVFFAYPSVGFNHKVILFENFYSIATHSLLFITSISMMTLGFTDYRYRRQDILKAVAMLLGVFGYASALILLGIEPDPLYFMPNNDVQAFLGVGYASFLVIYTGFLFIYFNAFYVVSERIAAKHSHRTDQASHISKLVRS